jgi:hypothetical protein
VPDAEDHELGGSNRRDTDHADRTPVVDVVLRHRASFVSNTAHCVPSSMDGSMKMKKRRTFTYFHSARLGQTPPPAALGIGCALK